MIKIPEKRLNKTCVEKENKEKRASKNNSNKDFNLKDADLDLKIVEFGWKAVHWLNKMCILMWKWYIPQAWLSNPPIYQR